MIDFSQPDQSLRALVKFRGSLDPQTETVYWWSGSIYSQIPGQPGRQLFEMEGINVGRMLEVPGGYQHLTREMSVYRDPSTGQPLTQWLNPLNNRVLEAVHLWNDPVNQQYLLAGPRPFRLPFTSLGEDQLCFHLEILLTYPSPLTRKNYPLNSQSDLYQCTELFQFYARRSDLENTALLTVPCHLSWTRVAPWLPWMEMGDQPGNLIYQCRGYKIPAGVADIPTPLRDFITEHHPEFLSAPETFTGPNETSWTYFKKLSSRQM
jgi:hypothetical protein